MYELLQMECREKCARKLERTLQCQAFEFPSLAVAEMATGDVLAELHASWLPPGARVLDMTAGLGIDAFAMARRASAVTAIELDPASARALEHNVSALGLENVTAVCADSVGWLREYQGEGFDLIFIDPARRDGAGRHFAFADCAPDVTSLLPLMLEKGAAVMIKASPMLDIDRALAELGTDCEVAVTGTRRECKELVFRLGEGARDGVTVCYTDGEPCYEYSRAAEKASAPVYGEPMPGDKLWQPWPAVMKGGPFGLLGMVRGCRKLHPSTHLYVGEPQEGFFPGREYRIVEIEEFSKRSCRQFAQRYPEINVAVRNFPLSAPALAARLKVREGGRLQLFGTTLAGGPRALLVAEPCQ